MFKHRSPWIIAIALFLCAGWCFYRWFNGIYEIPTDPEQLTLFSLYSMDGGDYEEGKEPPMTEKFGQYPVLGKVEIVDHDLRKRIMAALEKGIVEHDQGPIPKCFYPRHALHVISEGRSTDYIICFQCQSIEILGYRKAGTKTTDACLSILNKTLIEAGVPLAPYYSDKTKQK